MSEIVGESGPLQLAQAACTPTNPRSLRGVVGWKVIIVEILMCTPSRVRTRTCSIAPGMAVSHAARRGIALQIRQS